MVKARPSPFAHAGLGVLLALLFPVLLLWLVVHLLRRLGRSGPGRVVLLALLAVVVLGVMTVLIGGTATLLLMLGAGALVLLRHRHRKPHRPSAVNGARLAAIYELPRKAGPSSPA